MWTDVKDLALSVFNDPVVSKVILPVIGAYVGYWFGRRQLRGAKRFDAAVDAQDRADIFRERFDGLRHGGAYAIGKQHRPVIPDETLQEAQVYDEAYAFELRVDELIAILGELKGAVRRAEIVTQENLLSTISPIDEVLKELKEAIYFHFMVYRIRQLQGDSGSSRGLARHDKSAIIYPLKPDELNERVNEALEALVAKLRKYIR